jgi:hypothetical protein
MTNLGQEHFGAMVQTVISEQAAKLGGEPTLSHADLERQANFAVEQLETVASDVRGTCGDERLRVDPITGQPILIAKPSAWGGPNIYALNMAELTGFFGDQKKLSGQDRLKIVTDVINQAGIPSGGHSGCAANGSFPTIMELMASQFTHWGQATHHELGHDYDQGAVYAVTHHAHEAVKSGRYKGWGESILADVLGDEAHQAIETLQPNSQHDARTVLRISVPGHTVGQTKLSQASGGQRSFVQTEWYCQKIENALAAASSDPQAGQIMRHAREALLWAVEQAVPNQELHHIALR